MRRREQSTNPPEIARSPESALFGFFAPHASPLLGVDAVQPLLVAVPPDGDVQLARPAVVSAPRAYPFLAPTLLSFR